MVISDNDIAKAISNNPDAGFRLLLDKYQEPVYWHIRRLVVSHSDAQDAAQEAFIRMFRSFSGRKTDCSLTAWIYRIATNEALRMIGRRKNDCVPLDNAKAAAAGIAAPQYVDYTDAVAVKLQNAILSLPDKQRLAFNLRYYDELSYDDIASITGSSASAAKVNYNIAKGKIVQYMNSHD